MSAAAFLPGFRFRFVEANGIRIHTATAGSGPPVLLLHGHPQTMVVWRHTAQALIEAGYSVVLTDLRGYGDSDKPPGGENHVGYSKREMARDQVEVMRALGHERFAVVGHDRGGRVAHRMALDWPDAVDRICVVDIAPTATMYAQTDKDFATAYFWWFFLIQPFDLPERMIGADPAFFLRTHIQTQLKRKNAVSEAVFQEYLRSYADRAGIHAKCEDYRAAAGIDLDHDASDTAKSVQAPLLAIWGAEGVVGRTYDVLETWREKAIDVRGGAVSGGHCCQEEAAEEFLAELLPFLRIG